MIWIQAGDGGVVGTASPLHGGGLCAFDAMLAVAPFSFESAPVMEDCAAPGLNGVNGP